MNEIPAGMIAIDAAFFERLIQMMDEVSILSTEVAILKAQVEDIRANGCGIDLDDEEDVEDWL